MRNKRRLLGYCKHGKRSDQPCVPCAREKEDARTSNSKAKTPKLCPHGHVVSCPAECPDCDQTRNDERARLAEAPESFPVDEPMIEGPLPLPKIEGIPLWPTPGFNVEEAYALLSKKIDALHAKFDEIAARQFADPTPDREFLTAKEAAAYLNVSVKTIYKMKHLHVKRGRSIRLRRSTLDRGFREAA